MQPVPTADNTTYDNAQAEQFLEEIVRIESPSHEEAEVTTHIVEWMTRLGYDEAYVDEVGNAVGIIGNGSRDIVLLGHIDTFMGNPPVHIDGRLLYGRGSVDAKGAFATFVMAGSRAQLPDDVRLIVVGAVEEEASTSAGARHIATQFQPDMCIIGEPSQWDRITLGYKGRTLIDWRWEGALAHSAGNVATAPEHAVTYWQHIQAIVAQYNEGREGIFNRLDATLQNINSGQDGAYGWSETTIGFRLPPSITPDELIELVQTDLNGATTVTYGFEHAHLSPRDTVLSRLFRRAIRQTGSKPRFVTKTGTSDMNVVAPIWNCPIVAYGPGDSSLDHTPDEHLDLDEYGRAIDVLTRVLNSL